MNDALDFLMVIKAFTGVRAFAGIFEYHPMSRISGVSEEFNNKRRGHGQDFHILDWSRTTDSRSTFIFVKVLAFSDGVHTKVMLPAQDHKRVFDEDQGANTGGMGAYAPCPLVDSSMLSWIATNVIQKAINGLRKENKPFVGKESLVDIVDSVLIMLKI